MSSSKRQTYRRMRPKKPMVDGDVDSAKATTHTRFAETQEDGSIIIKKVLESLDPSPSVQKKADTQFNYTHVTDNENVEMHNISPPFTPQPRKCRVNNITFIFERNRFLTFLNRLRRITYWSMWTELIAFWNHPCLENLYAKTIKSVGIATSGIGQFGDAEIARGQRHNAEHAFAKIIRKIHSIVLNNGMEVSFGRPNFGRSGLIYLLDITRGIQCATILLAKRGF